MEESQKMYPRLLLTAGASGSGKTLITCGLLQALKNRGLTVMSFKCGPDYIDPMFHERVLKTKARNLDTFFTGETMTRYLFAQNAAGADISILEGVMGYYDGLGGISDAASAYDLARVTETPSVLIVNTRGMSLSVLAYIRGFLEYRQDSRIRGVILNQMPAGLYEEIRQKIEEELGVRVFGYVPKVTDCLIESRHLGLVLPDEVAHLEEKLQKLAGVLEKSLDIDGLLELAKSAETLPDGYPEELAAEGAMSHLKSPAMADIQEPERSTVTIAVARDEAFCFIYEDNLQLLQKCGARIVEFSPIHDRKLPTEADGLLLYGGYPELYAGQLSENRDMLADIRGKITAGMPCMAECGGFMYLHRTMEDMEKKEWQMAGVINAKAYRTDKLIRFGYIELEEVSDQGIEEAQRGVPAGSAEAADRKVPAGSAETAMGKIRGHEFHYFDSTDNGACFLAKKPLRKRSWRCIHRTDALLAGFPHLYYYSHPQIAVEFVQKCVRYHARRCIPGNTENSCAGQEK